VVPAVPVMGLRRLIYNVLPQQARIDWPTRTTDEPQMRLPLESIKPNKEPRRCPQYGVTLHLFLIANRLATFAPVRDSCQMAAYSTAGIM
jgi:hypothetical protein